MTLKQYYKIAVKIAEVVDYVMLNELGVYPPENYDLDNVGERVALGASFNPMQMGRSLNVYESEATARRLSDALDGLPVVITRKQGLRYIIPLNGRPQLPRMAELPENSRSGIVSIGVRHNGKTIAKPWKMIGHTMAAGKTRSGKSAFLRLMAYQALRDDFLLAISDNDLTTFPMLTNHPALFAPIATDPFLSYALIEKVNAECDSRAVQFKSMAGYPETLDEYNGLALKNGSATIKPMLVILDEVSNTIIRSGSRQKQFTSVFGALGMRTLKFGIHIIFAAHEFTKDQIGLIRPQCETVLCFRNEAEQMSALMGCPGSERIKQDRQGMAVTNKWGKLQTFYLDKKRMGGGTVDGGQLTVIGEREAGLVERSMAEAEGRMSIPLLMEWGLSEWDARQLVEMWELRGWLEKDPKQDNARFITGKLADLLSNHQTAQTVSNHSNREEDAKPLWYAAPNLTANYG
jgi:hypothetical protein